MTYFVTISMWIPLGGKRFS